VIKTVSIDTYPYIQNHNGERNRRSRDLLIACLDRMLAARAFKSAIRVQLTWASVRQYSLPLDLPVPKTKKLWDSAEEAIHDVKSGDTLMCGGACGLS
jgi:hypothetical protein